jgi:hypothetical protein
MRSLDEITLELENTCINDRLDTENLSFPIFMQNQGSYSGVRYFTYETRYLAEGEEQIIILRILEWSLATRDTEVFAESEWNEKEGMIELPTKRITESDDIEERVELFQRVLEDSETIKDMVFRPLEKMSAMEAAFVNQYYYNWMRCMGEKMFALYWKYGREFIEWMEEAAKAQGLSQNLAESDFPLKKEPAGNIESEPVSRVKQADVEDQAEKVESSVSEPQKNGKDDMRNFSMYLVICKIIESEPWGKDLLLNTEARASIAYLVDYYRADPKFRDMKNNMKDAVYRNDENELCWMLYRWIKSAVLDQLNPTNKEDIAYSRMLETLSRDQRELHKQGKCRIFWIIRKKDYPQWFQQYWKMKARKK